MISRGGYGGATNAEKSVLKHCIAVIGASLLTLQETLAELYLFYFFCRNNKQRYITVAQNLFGNASH